MAAMKRQKRRKRRDMEYLDQYIEHQMTLRNWSMMDLVRATGLPRTTLSNLIGSQRVPTVATVVAIANAFEVPVTEVLEAAGFRVRPEVSDADTHSRYGRVIASITPLRELYDVLQKANIHQIEHILAYARQVIRRAENAQDQ